MNDIENRDQEALGDVADNNAAYIRAMEMASHDSAGDKHRALELLLRLREHITRTGEHKSRIWLLPIVTLAIDKLALAVSAATAAGTLI